MKRLYVLIVLLCLVLIGIVWSMNKPSVTPPSHPTPQAVFCTPKDLESRVSLDPGAGNMYGAITITNTSEKTCQILANKVIQPEYDNTKVKNVKVELQKPPTFDLYTLAPDQAIYSQIHYPNGPQCNPPMQLPMRFSYMITDTEKIYLVNQNGQSEWTVMSCALPGTVIDVWPLSDSPITP